MLLTTIMVINIFTVIPVEAADTKKDSAYKAYYELIQKLNKGDKLSDGFDRFKLIYVDKDDIPELLAVNTPSDTFDNNGTYRYELYTYYDGKAVKLGSYASGVASAGGYRGDTMYIKKSGKIYETYTSAGSGDGCDIVYKMQNGTMTEIARGEFNIASDTAAWQGKTMSYTKYSKKLNKAFKTQKGKSFEELSTYSYKYMRKKLKSFIASYDSITLEDKIDVKEMKNQSTQQMEALGLMQYYNDFDIQISGNDVTYKYYYSSLYDSQTTAIKNNLKSNESILSDSVKAEKDAYEKEYAIRPNSITYAYYNSDGSELIYEYKE